MAIDPGPVVVDGVDDVLADHHNKQRVALLALETGTTAQTTLGTISTGVWNGTAVPVLYGGTGSTTAPLARTALGIPHQVISDSGQTGYTSVNKTTAFAGAKPDIAANSLAVGDLLQVRAWGDFETIGGAQSTIKWDLDFDAVNITTVTTANIAVTNAITWFVDIDIRIVTIGGSGTATSILRALTTNSLATTVAASYLSGIGSSLAVIDTTQALTIDLSTTLSSGNASNTMVCRGIVGYYWPKFT